MARWLAIVACLAAATACGPPPASGDGGFDPANPCAGGVPEDLPASCPNPVPSYRADVLPILEQRCLPCHTPGSPLWALPDMSTYAAVYADRGVILDQIAICKMPNLGGGGAPLTEPARQAVMGWLVCGAPDN